MNVMLVVFCAILVVFVFFSSKVSDMNKTKQAEMERSANK
jgi:preprotein translocase subunit SecG